MYSQLTNFWPGATSVGQIFQAQDQDSSQPEGEPGEAGEGRADEEKPQGERTVRFKVEARLE